MAVAVMTVLLQFMAAAVMTVLLENIHGLKEGMPDWVLIYNDFKLSCRMGYWLVSPSGKIPTFTL